MAGKKVRVPIPGDMAAEVLFKSDRTCCVCHKTGKQVQIHHINDDPSDNRAGNLAVLCLECHAQTQINGGFGRKLNSTLVVLYRNHWINVIEMRRAAESLESELIKDSPKVVISPENSKSSLSPAKDATGNTFHHLGIAITLLDSTWALGVYLNNSGYRPGSPRAVYELVTAAEGAKFVTVTTRVSNDGKRSIDLTCGRPVASYIFDDRDRRFDPIKGLDHVRGNPECNYRLQPGFTADMAWIYQVPLDADVRIFQFEDVRDLNRDRMIKPVKIPIFPRPSTD